ncbi:MAG: hypothetical protein LBV45_03670 [Xanthomonadaceae bacterium]|jgi:hypothetical protein|nr:hypothetical protein [Xanthomonadaceae bacterium]
MGKKIDNKTIIKEIISNYHQQEKGIITELFMQVGGHSLTAGTHREKVWKVLFEQIIPKKFCIEQGVFLIDSQGSVSREIDLVIFDEQYTPYIFKNKNIKFIPIEAALTVVQCKSEKYAAGSLKEWVESIDNLAPNNQGIAGTVNGIFITNENRNMRPLRILCGLFNPPKSIHKYCDLAILANKKNKDKLEIHYRFKTFSEIAKEIANLEIKNDIDEVKKEILQALKLPYSKNLPSLLQLMLYFNQCLMFINNPMLFPHQAYADMFNCLSDDPEETANEPA